MPRPKAHINWDEAGKMIMAGCDGVQVAAYFGIHPDTLYLACEKDLKMGFSDYLHQKRSKGDSMLLAKQYEVALTDKNPTMLIWLGKQRLNQREKSETDITSKGEKINEIKITWPDGD